MPNRDLDRSCEQERARRGLPAPYSSFQHVSSSRLTECQTFVTTRGGDKPAIGTLSLGTITAWRIGSGFGFGETESCRRSKPTVDPFAHNLAVLPPSPSIRELHPGRYNRSSESNRRMKVCKSF